MQYFLEHIEAMCDLDSRHLDEADAFLKKGAGRAATLTNDYRRLLDSKDLDTVMVTVPDQWHALMTIEACQGRKRCLLREAADARQWRGAPNDHCCPRTSPCRPDWHHAAEQCGVSLCH